MLVWTLDLRTGRILSQQSLPFGEHDEVPDALAVDSATGNLFLAVHVAYETSVAELIQVDPATQTQRAQALPAATTSLMVDGRAQRVIVSSATSVYPSTTTLTAFRPGDLRQEWAHAYTYSLIANALDARAHQVWVVDPGGRVVALDAATGRDDALMHLAYTRPSSWDPHGFALDSASGVGYAVWQEGYGGVCHIDRADARHRVRRMIATYACVTTGTQLLGFDALHSALLTAGEGTLSAVDAHTGAIISTTTGIPAFSLNHSWDQGVILTGAGRVSVAVPNRVAHQDDETGATTAGAIIIVTF